MNILVVKLSSLGDVVQTFPMVADILRLHPEAQIDWVVEEAFAPLVARVVGIRRVIPIALRRWRKSWYSPTSRQERAAFKTALRETTYDAVIDCQGLTKSALVARTARLAAGGKRGSFANKSDACGYEWPVKFLLSDNQPMPKRIHAVARTRLLAAKLLGYESRTEIWQAMSAVVFKDLPEKSSIQVVMFAHGTTRLENEWSFANWHELGDRLISSNYEIDLPSATERESVFCKELYWSLIERVGDGCIVLPKMNLSELLDQMSTCVGVIGVDSGLSHMAVALGLPHVQIFSQDRAWRAGPLPVSEGGVAHQVALGGTHIPSADEVWQAWQKVSAC